ncbi:putative Hook3 protein [Ilyonectria robusta]
MPTYSPSAQAALLRASNRVFEPKTTADSLAELADGIVLGHILHELDPEFNPSELDQSPSTTRYLTNKRNIQMVYKGLFRFIRRQVPELGCQAKKFDYHGIAENPEPQGISQLLAVMLSAAAMGPDNQRFVPRIQNGLDKQTQAEIMQIIRTMQLDINNSRGDDDLDEAIDAVMEARDIDLLVEEQNAALRQQLDLTKKNLSDYITRLEYLQQSHEELKYEKEKNDRELEVLRKATQDGANSAESIKVLEAQVHEQMEIIARNEELIRKYERNLAHLESEVQRLTQKSIEADELRDQVMEWKHKSEELEKKANTAERYKQKLESQQHLVREVQNLQYEKAELQDQLRSLTSDHERSDRTRKAEDELTKMITQSEQHLWDERHQKTQLMKDMTALEEEVVRLRARQSHDENFIKDLQEQLQNNSGPQGGIPGDSGAAFNLEDELNSAAEDGQVNLPLELSRLKAENALLRSTVGSTGDTMTLRKELDEEKRQRAHLQQSFNDVFEKHAVAQDQIEALIKNMTNEGTQAFVNLRTQCMQSNFELEQCRKQVKDLEAQVADQGRELLDARTQLSALGKDSIEALNELKNTDRLIRESLKAELDRVRQELGYSGAERDARETQLVEALLEKDKLRKAVEESKELQDATPSDADNSEAGKKNAEKVEKLRARLIEIRKQLETSEQDKIDLQRKLKAAHDGEAAAAQKLGVRANLGGTALPSSALFFPLFCFARIARELGEFRFKGIARMGDGRYVAMERRETAFLEIG